jgi:manganese transport protein
VANDRHLMGDLVNGRVSNTLGVLTLGVSLLVAVAAFPLLVLTRAGSG